MAYTLHEEVSSNDRRYRYSLTTRTEAAGSGRLAVIQCNPSLASTGRSDATVGKVSFWAEEHGFSIVTFLNLFAYISPYQSTLGTLAFEELVGADNDEYIRAAVTIPESTVVLAWGGLNPAIFDHYARRLVEVKNILDQSRASLHHVGRLSYGKFPRHGRMWNKNDRDLMPLDWAPILASATL